MILRLFFAYLLYALGSIVVLLTGTCSAVVLSAGSRFNDVIMFSGIPFAMGLALLWFGFLVMPRKDEKLNQRQDKQNGEPPK